MGPKMVQLLHFELNKNFYRKSKSQFYLSLSDNHAQFHKTPIKRFSKKFKSVTLEKNFSENSKWSLLPTFKYLPSGKFDKNLMNTFREKFKHDEFCPKKPNLLILDIKEFLKIRTPTLLSICWCKVLEKSNKLPPEKMV